MELLFWCYMQVPTHFFSDFKYGFITEACMEIFLSKKVKGEAIPVTGRGGP
jgi:hypothetical protein